MRKRLAVLKDIPAESGVAFAGEIKLARKATGYEKRRRPSIRQRVRRLREPNFPAPFDVSVTHRFL